MRVLHVKLALGGSYEKKSFYRGQIVKILTLQENGLKVIEICR